MRLATVQYHTGRTFLMMTQPRQSLIKPTVLNDVLKLPAKEMQQVMEKVAMLQLDPLPDGKAKKQLIHLPGRPYRIRSGLKAPRMGYSTSWQARRLGTCG